MYQKSTAYCLKGAQRMLTNKKKTVSNIWKHWVVSSWKKGEIFNKKNKKKDLKFCTKHNFSIIFYLISTLCVNVNINHTLLKR